MEIIIPNTLELRRIGIRWIKLVKYCNTQGPYFEIESLYARVIYIPANSYRQIHDETRFFLLNESRAKVQEINILLKFLSSNEIVIQEGIKELTKK